MIKTQTLKGFRDFLPGQARKRQYVIDKLKSVFELYGFAPLETPVLEYEELLMGKYGEEGDKLMYRFEDNGKRRVAMRYDQTVPLARVIAQYGSQLPMPFKRYQIQNVWRAENTQKGRYRELIQCDIDTVGSSSILADAEIVQVIEQLYTSLGFTNIKILVNDRAVFGDLSVKAITILDKLDKIGKEGVLKELVAGGIYASKEEAQTMFDTITQTKPTEYVQALTDKLNLLGVETKNIIFSPTLARGLDYYTGLIIEIASEDYPFGSLGGGGRYDNLIGMFSGEKTPAVGFAVGFDRTMEAMEALKLFPKDLDGKTKVLVSIFSKNLETKSMDIVSLLRQADIPAEIYLGEIKDKNPLEKQLKYALAKQIPYLAIIGTDEAEKGRITLKNLQTREQKQVSADNLINELQ